VLAEIARYHDKTIRLTDNSLAGLRVSGTFPSKRLDSLLNAVAHVLHVKIGRQGDEILIKQTAKTR
jgi:ferric-dicitrate binding protein FerR (iron transport regulator)